MKKILIISDSHLNNDFVEIINMETPDYTLHAGDSQLKEDSEYLDKVDYIVRGNCDYAKFLDDEKFEIDNHKFLLTHGHRYNVKMSLANLVYTAQEEGINVLVYGHTHVVHIEYLEQDNLLIINPGSTTFGRSKYKNTYVVLEITDNTYEVHLNENKTFKTLRSFSFIKK